tara:strand:+ start:613 stop:816 length:204 start_codon:yes stop_codon:yes gene_type:complete
MKIYKTWKGSGETFESDINDLMDYAVTGKLSKKEVIERLECGTSFQSLGAFWSQDKYKKDRVRLFCD